MGANLEFFEKFIVKQIVNTVVYNPITDEYEINRIHISDDIIKSIEEEGFRYGLQKSQVAQMISRVSESIRTTPSSKLRYDSIDVGKIKMGQHLRIHIFHPEKGSRNIDLLNINKYRFLVIDSDIAGIGYGDEIHALDGTWNVSFYIDFHVYRNSLRVPNEDNILRLGKLSCVEFLSPSIVNEILDSKSTYSFESIKTNKTIIDKSKSKIYYFWMPNFWKPIKFCWKEGDAQNEAATFIIIDNEDSQDAKIIINKAFVLSQEADHLDTFMGILFDCCKWKNQFTGIEDLKHIRSVKAGVVRRTMSEIGEKEWKLISQPQIKFVYG